VVWTAVSSLQSAPGALLRLDLKRKTVAATPFPRQDITVHDLEPDGDIIWLGTSAGVLRMSLGQDPPLLRPLGGE
jgi:streptogramin lyase